MNETWNATSSSYEEELFTGVTSTYEDLFESWVFFLALFAIGDVFCRRVLRVVPPLVGYIMVGMTLGPEGFGWVPYEEAWVLLGNLGLVLLIAQAGLEMDLVVLKKIGLRGIIIAVVGSVLPISLGMLLSWAALNQTGSTVIAMGCCFGPTSAGIAINVLGQCGVLERPVGQLVLAAAIVDDILALLVLSQLQALTTQGDVNTTDIVVPIISAFAWLFVGGGLALVAAPVLFEKFFQMTRSELCDRFIDRFRLDQRTTRNEKEERTTLALGTLLLLIFLLLPATTYSRASYLLGAFLAGLSFCQEPGLDQKFRKEFETMIRWLMMIFFAATIGFQVPVSLFGDGIVLRQGFLLSAALLGKIAVGPLLTPKFDDNMHFWRGDHLRDCLVVGFSMSSEAEFAFVVAVFGVTEGLIPPDLYASVVLAILLSTIVSPLLLRTTLALAPFPPIITIDNNEDPQPCEKNGTDTE